MEREETSMFPGDWAALKGKTVKPYRHAHAAPQQIPARIARNTHMNPFRISIQKLKLIVLPAWNNTRELSAVFAYIGVAVFFTTTRFCGCA